MINFLLAQAAPEAPPLQPLPHPALPEVFIPPAPIPIWIFIVCGLLLVAMLALVLWLLLRPRPPEAIPPKRPWVTAMTALRELSSRTRSQPPGKTAAEVSEILRQYFLVRYKIPAPFRTTHEIFQGGSIPSSSSRLQKYAPLAELWDSLSFAPVPASTDEASELLARAITFLEEDRPGLGAEVKEEAALPPLHSGLGLRKLTFGMAWFYFLLAAVILGFLLFDERHQIVWWAFPLIVAVPVYFGIRELRAARAMDPRQIEYTLDPDAPLDEQIRFYWIRVIAAPLIAIPLTAWVAYDMEKLNSGEVENVRVWAPIAMMYDLFGYWGAVLVFPLFAIITVIMSLSRLKVLKLHLAHQSQPK